MEFVRVDVHATRVQGLDGIVDLAVRVHLNSIK